MTDLTLALGLDTKDWHDKLEEADASITGFLKSIQGLPDIVDMPELKGHIQKFIPIIDEKTKIIPDTTGITLKELDIRGMKVLGGKVGKIKVDLRRNVYFIGKREVRNDFQAWLKDTLKKYPIKGLKMHFVRSMFLFDGDPSPKKQLTKIFNKIGNIEGIKWKIDPNKIDVGGIEIPIKGIGSLQETISTMPKSISVDHTSDIQTINALEGITDSVNDLGRHTMKLVEKLTKLLR